MESVTAAPSRPRDVVFAGVLTIIGSVLALIGVFTAQGELRTSGARREIESVLADDRFSAIDISVDTVLNLVEVGLMVASAASVAAIVLAVYSMRGHNPSRIALTLLGGLAAVGVLLSGLTGFVIALFVVYTVSLLWRKPVRVWFAQASGSNGDSSGADAGRAPDPAGGPGPSGHPGHPRYPEQPGEPGQPGDSEQPGQAGHPVQPGDSEQPGPYPRPWPPDPQAPAQPDQAGQPQPDPYRPQPGQPPGPFSPAPPEQGYGGPPGYPPSYPADYPPDHAQGYPQGHPQQYGYGHPPAYYGYPPAQSDPNRRPAQVTAAHVMTWIGAAFGLLTGVFFVIAAGSDEIVDLVMEQLATSGISEDEFVTMLRLAGVLTALWSLAVLVVSVFSWRRANWAAILLTVMGGGYLVFQLITLLTGQLAVLFTIVWVAAVLVLLWWPTSRRWYTEARHQESYGPPGGGSSYPQGPPRPPKRNQPW